MRAKVGNVKVSKKTLAMTQEAGVGTEEIAAVSEFCEAALTAQYRLKNIREEGDEETEDARVVRIRELEAEKAKAEYEQEREMFQKTITELQDFIRRDEKRVSLFRWLTAMLPGREKLVLRRLYEEGFAWSRVYDDEGILLKPGSVQYGRNNGLALMAIEVRRRSMWAEINALKGERE